MKRRTFIQSSAATAAAAALPALWVGLSATSQEVQASTVQFENPWIRITSDNQVSVFASRSEMGQDAYTTIVMMIAEELDYPIERLHIEMAPNNPKVFGNMALGGFQLTGASTTVRDGWGQVRKVGASTRALLVQAAARKWGVSQSEVSCSQGYLMAGQRKATYGEMAALAAAETVSGDPPLKAPKDWRYIGKELKRLDTPAKVKGTAVFGVDVRHPGMLAAAVRQCPVIGGKLKAFDASAAEKIPGVRGIHRIGDAVGVLADDFYLAEKAKALIKCDWDTGDTSRRKDLNTIMSLMRQTAQTPGVVVNKKGQFEDPMQGAARVIKAEYETSFAAHATMEPMNCSVAIENGICHVWGPFQFPQGVGMIAAGVTGLPPEKVQVHTTFLGGGFGRKLEGDAVVQALMLAKASGKPVRLIWSREDDMQHDFYRPGAVHPMSAALSADGKLLGLSGRSTSHSTLLHFNPAGVKDGLDPWAIEGFSNCTYEAPNMRLESKLHDTGVQVGFWRAVSNNMNLFALESFIDEVAHSAGQDPIAFRMPLLEKHPRAQAVLKLAAEKTGWGKPRSDGRALGIAQAECYQSFVAVVAEVSMKGKEPVVHKLTCVIDCGLGLRPNQIEAQIEGGLVMGYFTAMRNRITFKDGVVVEDNFDSYPTARFEDIPQIEVIRLPSDNPPSGVGEAGVPLAAPAIANAIAKASGKRLRKMPFLEEA